jgi:hypothetical protein
MSKIKTLAANMSVLFNPDGLHLKRFLKHKKTSIYSFIESILLHDEIIIPIQDYSSVTALLHLLGEDIVIKLLELGVLKFVRLMGVMVYMRGSEEEGGNLVAIESVHNRPVAFSAPKSQAINTAFSVLGTEVKNRDLLLTLLIQATEEISMGSIVDEIRDETYQDLKKTPLWRNSYSLGDTELKRFPGIEPFQVRFLGLTSKPNKNVIDALLSIALTNTELRLAQKLECIDSSTASPVGRVLKLKAQRTFKNFESEKAFTYLREIAAITNIGEAVLNDRSLFMNILKLRESRNGEQFRQWFHENCREDKNTIADEYNKLIRGTSLIQSKKNRILRFVVTEALGFTPVIGPIIGLAAGAADSFFIEKLLKGNSPKFFIDDLYQFDGTSKGFGKN